MISSTFNKVKFQVPTDNVKISDNEANSLIHLLKENFYEDIPRDLRMREDILTCFSEMRRNPRDFYREVMASDFVLFHNSSFRLLTCSAWLLPQQRNKGHTIAIDVGEFKTTLHALKVMYFFITCIITPVLMMSYL